MKFTYTLKSVLPVFLILTVAMMAFHQKEARSNSQVITNYLLKAYRAYFAAVDLNAEMRRLPYPVKQRLAPHFSGLNLERVWYGESRYLVVPDTAMTDCSRIYFPSDAGIIDIVENGHLFEKKYKNDLHWLLHELTHSQQCQAQGGRDEYAKMWFGDLAAATLTQLLINPKSVNERMLHNAMPMEKDAEQNAVIVLNRLSK